jgi:hypothetical protein
MAEAVGLIASGINIAQLASQVASSVLELKRMWNLVRDAPSDINDYIAQVESINLILSHIQHEHGQEMSLGKRSDNVYIQKSVHFYKEAADELDTAVAELSDKIRGKTGWRLKVGLIKIVLKRDNLQKLRVKMRSAIAVLSLACQYHTK